MFTNPAFAVAVTEGAAEMTFRVGNIQLGVPQERTSSRHEGGT